MAFLRWDLRRLDARLRFTLLDVLLNFCLLTPLTVVYWHGTSALLHAVLLRSFPVLGAWLLLFLGIGLQLASSVLQTFLPSQLPTEEDVDSVAFRICSARLYNYVVAFATVCHMQGLGELYGYYVGEDWYSSVKAISTGLLALWGLRCGRHILGPPLHVELDTQDIYLTSTLFQTEPDLSPENLLDNVASTVIASSFAHLHWVGVWSLFDLFFPTNPWISLATSLAVGYAITVTFLLLQNLAQKISWEFQKKDNEIGRVLFENSFIFLSNLGCIAVWRGIWIIFDILAENFPMYYKGYDVTALATNVISFLIMCLAMASNTLSDKGVDSDNTLPVGEGVLFETSYFTHFLSDEVLDETSAQTWLLSRDVHNSLMTSSIPAESRHVTPAVATVAPSRSRATFTISGSQGMGFRTPEDPEAYRGVKGETRRTSTGSIRKIGVSRNSVIDPEAAIGKHNVAISKQVTFGYKSSDSPTSSPFSTSLRSALTNGMFKKTD